MHRGGELEVPLSAIHGSHDAERPELGLVFTHHGYQEPGGPEFELVAAQPAVAAPRSPGVANARPRRARLRQNYADRSTEAPSLRRHGTNTPRDATPEMTTYTARVATHALVPATGLVLTPTTGPRRRG